MMTSHPEFGALTEGKTVTSAFCGAIKGKTVIITGVSPNGLGMSTAEALANQEPALLVLTGRSKVKVEKVINELAVRYPKTSYRYLHLDLSSLRQVREAAREVMAYPDIPKIDLVICNAGVMAIPQHEMSADNIELQFATNHVGHFLFVNLILDKIVASAKVSLPGTTRVAIVSSTAHHLSPVRFSDPNFTIEQGELPEAERANFHALEMLKLPIGGRYNQYVAYGQSKTANVLFALGLNHRLYNKYGIIAYAVHPGTIFTDLWRHSDDEFIDKVKSSKDATGTIFKTLEQGCSTTLVAGLDPRLGSLDVENGIYLEDCQLSESATWTKDVKEAERLWDLSERLVGQKFSNEL